jgi:hypothetical protein
MSATTFPIVAETYAEARDAAIAASTLNPHTNPVVAVKGRNDGSYEADEFPLGYPLPRGYVIAARYVSRGKWRRLAEAEAE